MPRPRRSWTPEQVIEAIKAWHGQGRPLVRFHRENRSASRAACIHFGSWHKAVAAAGIPAGWQHKWNRQRVIEALQAYGRQGYVRCNQDIPNPVRMAAFYLFGTWHNALVAAGLASPESRPVPKKRWTKAKLLVEIRRQSVPGLPMRITHNLAFATAARKHFGSWQQALLAAGIDPVSWQTWSPQRVLAEIRAWRQRGAPVENDRLEYRRLQVAARARFGSWRRALIAAGVRRPGQYMKWERKWTEQRIIEAIQDRHIRGLSLVATVDYKLSAAGARHFGSWHAALQAAGLLAGKKRRARRRWSRQSVIQEIQMRQSHGLEMINVRRTDSGLEAAARKHFGNWHNAIRAAGMTVRCRRQWSRPKIIAAIHAHHKQGSLSHVWRIDKPLYYSGAKWFGSWHRALVAAGITRGVKR